MQLESQNSVYAAPRREHAQPLIAIIDDDESVRVALSNCIESYGFAAQGYASAEAFLADFPQSGLACIVTDVQMPGMGGLALQAWLNRIGCETAIAFITAYADEATRRTALARGAVGFFTKPFSSAALMKCLENQLIR